MAVVMDTQEPYSCCHRIAPYPYPWVIVFVLLIEYLHPRKDSGGMSRGKGVMRGVVRTELAYGILGCIDKYSRQGIGSSSYDQALLESMRGRHAQVRECKNTGDG